MTRRDFIWTAAAAANRPAEPQRLRVPLHRVVDSRVWSSPQLVRHFWSSIWREAFRDFSQGGIELQTTDGPGEVRHTAGDNPVFIGLRRGALNLVLTDHLPLYWDNSRALAGATTLWEGYPVCVIALRYAHGNQVPFLSVNTCVHELLHAMLGDILVKRPAWYESGGRELRIDWVATCLWLFHDGAAIRKSLSRIQ